MAWAGTVALVHTLYGGVAHQDQLKGYVVLGHIRNLLVGNGLAQALQFLSILVLSRMYYPSDFGVLAQVQSISTLAVVIATLQLHLSIPLCKNNAEARISAEAVQSICIVFAAVILPVAFYFGKMPAFASFLTLFLGLNNTYSSFLVFNGEFGSLSRFYVFRAVLIVGLQIMFAWLAVPDGLVWGAVLAECVSSVYLRTVTLGSPFRMKMDIRTGLGMARRLKAFSLYGTIQELTSVAAFYAPLFLFAHKFGESIGGQYAMASRLVWAPVVLVSSSLAQVLYHSMGKQGTESLERMRHLFVNPKIFAGIALLSALPFFMEDIFLLVLGDQWELASQLMPLQILWGCIFLLSTPFRVACRVLHLQKYQLTVDAGVFATAVTLFVAAEMSPMGIMWGLVVLAVAQHSILSALVWGAMKPCPLKGGR